MLTNPGRKSSSRSEAPPTRPTTSSSAGKTVRRSIPTPSRRPSMPRSAAPGLPRIRLHDLRHTHATIALRAGIPVKVISERLGHENPAFTMKQYAHVLPGMQAKAAALIAAHADRRKLPTLRANRCEAAVRQRPGAAGAGSSSTTARQLANGATPMTAMLSRSVVNGPTTEAPDPTGIGSAATFRRYSLAHAASYERRSRRPHWIAGTALGLLRSRRPL